MSARSLPDFIIHVIRTGRLVPQEPGTKTIIAVSTDTEGDTLRVQEITKSGRIIGTSDFPACDPEINNSNAIKEYLATHNFWSRRK